MTAVLQFFWFLVAAVWLVNVGTAVRPRLLQMEAEGQLEPEEAGSALFWIAVPVAVMFGIFGVIQLVAGWTTPLCIYTFDWSNWAVTGTLGLNLAAIGALLGWLQFGSGAEVIARFGPAFGLNASTSLIRWGGTVLLVAIVVSTFVMVEPAQFTGMC